MAGFLAVEAPLPNICGIVFCILGFTIPETAKPKRIP